MNLVILQGFIGKDPELKTFENGGQVCNFSLATNESYTNKNGERIEQTEWHNITFSGKQAEIVAKYFKKGSRILLQGKLRTRSWENQNGEKRYLTEILGRSFEFIDSKKDQGSTVDSYKAAQNDLQPQGEEDDLPF